MEMNLARDDNRYGPHLSRPARTRTCLSGKLVYGDPPSLPHGSFTLDCMIKDISAGGAKVVIARHQFLPTELYLIVVKSCVAYCATIVWQKFPARGLKFSQTYSLKDGMPGELKYLQALWANLHARSGCSN